MLSFIDSVKAKAPGAFEAFKSGAIQAVAGPLGGVADLLGNMGKKGDTAKLSQKELAEQVRLTAEAQQEETEASNKQAAALDKVTTATLSAVSSQLGYESSLNRLLDNINDLDDKTQAYNDAVAENGRNSKEAEAANRSLRDAQLGIKESALAAAGAAVKLADDQATAAGVTLDASAKSIVFRNELIRLADQASGPTRDAILGLADEVAGIPNRTVTVSVDTSAAREEIASLQRQLNSIEGGSTSTSGAQQFARGMDVGPVRGPAGKAVPIIAHAGEWVLTPEQLAELRRNSFAPSSVTTSTLSASTALTISGPLVVIQGSVAPGQEGAIGSAVRQAVTQMVADGTVGRAMSQRSASVSRR